VQTDLYLSHPCRDFAKTDEALRLREEGGRVALFYKGPKLDPRSKTREELSVAVPDPAAMRMILERLGFRPVAEVRKTRRNFGLGPVEVSLDRVAGLSGYVELEVQDRPVEEGRSMLLALIRSLDGGDGKKVLPRAPPREVIRCSGVLRKELADLRLVRNADGGLVALGAVLHRVPAAERNELGGCRSLADRTSWRRPPGSCSSERDPLGVHDLELHIALIVSIASY
jgi:adenylate cyclase class 2